MRIYWQLFPGMLVWTLIFKVGIVHLNKHLKQNSMKRIILLLLSCAFGLAVMSQASTLTLILKGEATRQVLVDGRDYTPSGLSTLDNATVTVTLNPGQHELRILRDRYYYNQNNDIRTSF